MSKISQIFLIWRNCPHLTIPSTWDLWITSISPAPTFQWHRPWSCIAQKSHPHGGAPSGWREWWEHILPAALDRNKAARLQLRLLPASVTKPPKSCSFPHNSQPRWFILTALGIFPPGEASDYSPYSIWFITTVYSAFTVSWLKFRVIGGALQFTLITYVPGFQVSHQLCQAAAAAGWLPRERISAGCPKQAMNMAPSCLSISKKMKSPTLMAEDSAGRLGSDFISPNGDVPGKQKGFAFRLLSL